MEESYSTALGHIVFSYQNASNGIHVNLELTLRSRDLRSTVDLDLMRSSYVYVSTYFDARQREDLDGAVIFSLAQLVQKLLTKTPVSSSAAILTFIPVTSFLTSSKM